MYGGKFMPFHKGHNYCIEVATNECEKVYVILFYGGADELSILRNNKEEYLTLAERKNISTIFVKNMKMLFLL